MGESSGAGDDRAIPGASAAPLPGAAAQPAAGPSYVERWLSAFAAHTKSFMTVRA